jgi:hypothetical protein
MTMPVLTLALIRVSIFFNSLFDINCPLGFGSFFIFKIKWSKIMKKIKQELQNRINDTIAKNTTKGLWHSLTKLKVSECKLGDIVLSTFNRPSKNKLVWFHSWLN